MSGLHFLVGIRTDEFVILAADRTAFAHGAIVVSNDEDKSFHLGEKLMMTAIGEKGDVLQFGDWAMRNIQLYKLRNGYEMSPQSAHHWIRKSIADSLRSQDYYVVDLLIGGYDDHEQKAFLGQVDYLGNGLADQPFLFRGFPGRFSFSILDKVYKTDMTQAEAMDALRKCLAEAKKRFIANLPNFQVIVIDKDGIHKLPDMAP